MRKVNLQSLDLNLLPALDALLRLKNVTLAAEDIGMSQPAMSRALARLRGVLGDVLLVRVGKTFALTERARELQQQVGPALERVAALYAPLEFDPRLSTRTVRIAASDSQTVLLVPTVMRRLALAAPQVHLAVTGYTRDMVARMETGELDFAFALSTSPLPAGAASMALARDRLALVMRRGHPAAGRTFEITDYGRYDNVTISLFNDGQSEFDALLAAHGVKRKIALTTPHFMAALTAVSATDMVTTLSRTLAQRFADTLDLELHDPPIADPDMNLVLVWAQIRGHDRFLVWLREVIRDAAVEVFGTT